MAAVATIAWKAAERLGAAQKLALCDAEQAHREAQDAFASRTPEVATRIVGSAWRRGRGIL